MSRSAIEWTEHTWNPVRGCSHVSPGCAHCYAERQAARFCRHGEPFHLFVKRTPKPHWTGRVELRPEMLEVPLRRRQPTTYFVNSMSDLFHESLAYQDRRKVFSVMRDASWHTYQILTKRATIMRDFMQWWVMQYLDQPPLIGG